MEFEQIRAAWTVLAGIMSAFVLCGGAVAVLSKLYNWARKPSDANAQRIKHIEECLDNDNRRIAKLERAMEESRQESKMLMRGVMQIMSHMVDGNHVDELRKCRDEFEMFLINK